GAAGAEGSAAPPSPCDRRRRVGSASDAGPGPGRGAPHRRREPVLREKRQSSSRPVGSGKSSRSNELARSPREASGTTPWLWAPSELAREWSTGSAVFSVVVVDISRRPLPSAVQ